MSSVAMHYDIPTRTPSTPVQPQTYNMASSSVNNNTKSTPSRLQQDVIDTSHDTASMHSSTAFILDNDSFFESGNADDMSINDNNEAGHNNHNNHNNASIALHTHPSHPSHTPSPSSTSPNKQTRSNNNNITTLSHMHKSSRRQSQSPLRRITTSMSTISTKKTLLTSVLRANLFNHHRLDTPECSLDASGEMEDSLFGDDGEEGIDEEEGYAYAYAEDSVLPTPASGSDEGQMQQEEDEEEYTSFDSDSSDGVRSLEQSLIRRGICMPDDECEGGREAVEKGADILPMGIQTLTSEQGYQQAEKGLLPVGIQPLTSEQGHQQAEKGLLPVGIQPLTSEQGHQQAETGGGILPVGNQTLTPGQGHQQAEKNGDILLTARNVPSSTSRRPRKEVGNDTLHSAWAAMDIAATLQEMGYGDNDGVEEMQQGHHHDADDSLFDELEDDSTDAVRMEETAAISDSGVRDALVKDLNAEMGGISGKTLGEQTFTFPRLAYTQATEKSEPASTQSSKSSCGNAEMANSLLAELSLAPYTETCNSGCENIVACVVAEQPAKPVQDARTDSAPDRNTTEAAGRFVSTEAKVSPPVSVSLDTPQKQTEDAVPLHSAGAAVPVSSEKPVSANETLAILLENLLPSSEIPATPTSFAARIPLPASVFHATAEATPRRSLRNTPIRTARRTMPVQSVSHTEIETGLLQATPTQFAAAIPLPESVFPERVHPGVSHALLEVVAHAQTPSLKLSDGVAQLAPTICTPTRMAASVPLPASVLPAKAQTTPNLSHGAMKSTTPSQFSSTESANTLTSHNVKVNAPPLVKRRMPGRNTRRANQANQGDTSATLHEAAALNLTTDIPISAQANAVPARTTRAAMARQASSDMLKGACVEVSAVSQRIKGKAREKEAISEDLPAVANAQSGPAEPETAAAPPVKRKGRSVAAVSALPQRRSRLRLADGLAASTLTASAATTSSVSSTTSRPESETSQDVIVKSASANAAHSARITRARRQVASALSSTAQRQLSATAADATKAPADPDEKAEKVFPPPSTAVMRSPSRVLPRKRPIAPSASDDDSREEAAPVPTRRAGRVMAGTRARKSSSTSAPPAPPRSPTRVLLSPQRPRSRGVPAALRTTNTSSHSTAALTPIDWPHAIVTQARSQFDGPYSPDAMRRATRIFGSKDSSSANSVPEGQVVVKPVPASPIKGLQHHLKNMQTPGLLDLAIAPEALVLSNKMEIPANFDEKDCELRSSLPVRPTQLPRNPTDPHRALSEQPHASPRRVPSSQRARQTPRAGVSDVVEQSDLPRRALSAGPVLTATPAATVSTVPDVGKTPSTTIVSAHSAAPVISAQHKQRSARPQRLLPVLNVKSLEVAASPTKPAAARQSTVRQSGRQSTISTAVPSAIMAPKLTAPQLSVLTAKNTAFNQQPYNRLDVTTVYIDENRPPSPTSKIRKAVPDPSDKITKARSAKRVKRCEAQAVVASQPEQAIEHISAQVDKNGKIPHFLAPGDDSLFESPVKAAQSAFADAPTAFLNNSTHAVKWDRKLQTASPEVIHTPRRARARADRSLVTGAIRLAAVDLDAFGNSAECKASLSPAVPRCSVPVNRVVYKDDEPSR